MILPSKSFSDRKRQINRPVQMIIPHISEPNILRRSYQSINLRIFTENVKIVNLSPSNQGNILFADSDQNLTYISTFLNSPFNRS